MIADKIYYAAADRITELEAALAERDATIAAAPHSPGCATKDYRRLYAYPPCDCWKSAAPGDAPTAHNAEVWDEGYAQAQEDHERHEWSMAPENPYRAKAIREGD